MVHEKPKPEGAGTPVVSHQPLSISTHDELVANLSDILRRINADPALGRLLVVNPLLVLEDVGVTLSPELKDHLRRTLGFPKGRVKQATVLRRELREGLDGLGRGSIHLPKTPKERAEFVFDTLGVAPQGERPAWLNVEDLKPYRARHPIVDMLYRLEVLERGALLYWSRGTYEEHKAGKPHHPWLRGLTFRV